MSRKNRKNTGARYEAARMRKHHDDAFQRLMEEVNEKQKEPEAEPQADEAFAEHFLEKMRRSLGV